MCGIPIQIPGFLFTGTVLTMVVAFAEASPAKNSKSGDKNDVASPKEVTVTSSVDPQEELFLKTANEVILAFSKGDLAALERLVEPKTGIYMDAGGNGVFHENTVGKIFYGDALKQYKELCTPRIVNATLPIFKCPKGWSKKGGFTEPKRVDHSLSEAMGYMSMEPQEIKVARQLEDISRRVIVVCDPKKTDGHRKNLEFSLSYLHSQWRLTIIKDSNCSE